MEGKKYNRQMEINDLIDDAIANALTRREDALLALSEEETAMIAGGTGVQEAVKIADYKPVDSPLKPTKPPIKPICPPIIVGLIALPIDDKQLS